MRLCQRFPKSIQDLVGSIQGLMEEHPSRQWRSVRIGATVATNAIEMQHEACKGGKAGGGKAGGFQDQHSSK